MHEVRQSKSDEAGGFCLTELSLPVLIGAALGVSALLWLLIGSVI